MNTRSVQKKPVYKVAIIGAGRIGCSFDSPDSKNILTHAHAFSKNPRTELVAIVDTDTERGKKEARRWHTIFFSDVDEMFDKANPDIVVVATPDKTHAELLIRCANMRPRLIVCEKPVVVTSGDEARVRKNVLGYVPVIVNFSRRFDPVVQKICVELAAGKYGKVISAGGIYTKGIFHNGSHMIDLMRFLFGEMQSCTAHFKVEDWGDGDPTVGGVAVFERCPQFCLLTGNARKFAVFDLDILTEKKRIRFTDEGQLISIQSVIPDPVYKGFRVLSKPVVHKTMLLSALSELSKHAVSVLDGKEKPQSTLDNALKTHEACSRFL